MRLVLAAALALCATSSFAQAPSPIAPPAARLQRAAPTMATPAPGGGSGQVWVNARSHVYHCQGDRYYGNTARGSYMTEAAARAAGDRPDHGRACGG